MPRQKLDKIKLLVTDFDGVHTDGFVYVDDKGKETVRCSRRDGLGIEMLKKARIKTVVISKEKNEVVLKRCRKLDIECFRGVKNSIGKKEILLKLIKREGLSNEEVLYIGDDINDIDALLSVGVAVTVADGHEKVKKISDIILKRKGGEHAIRELTDMLLTSRGINIRY